MKNYNLSANNFDSYETDEPETSNDCERSVDDDVALRQRKSAVTAAYADFDFSLLNVTTNDTNVLVPANDNDRKRVESLSWPLFENIMRYEKNDERQKAHLLTIKHLNELLHTSGVDPMSLSIHQPGKTPSADFQLSRIKDKKRPHSMVVAGIDGQFQGVRHRDTFSETDGELKVRREPEAKGIKRSDTAYPVFDVHRDDLFQQRFVDARNELADYSAVVGPLWKPLLRAISDRAGFTEIAKELGYKQPVVGSAVIKMALEAATEHRVELGKAESFRQYVSETRFPVAARRYERALQEAA